jgi:hypothetical protein
MLPGNHTRPLSQAFRAKYFAPDWPDKLFPRSIPGAAKETPQNFRGRLWWDYGRHEAFLTLEMCLLTQFIPGKLLP